MRKFSTTEEFAHQLTDQKVVYHFPESEIL